jgi:ligand-binding sensor domain-containing protein
LARRKGKGFVVLTTANGLISDYVFAVDSAADGSLWVGSYGGVARLRTNL